MSAVYGCHNHAPFKPFIEVQAGWKRLPRYPSACPWTASMIFTTWIQSARGVRMLRHRNKWNFLLTSEESSCALLRIS